MEALRLPSRLRRRPTMKLDALSRARIDRITGELVEEFAGVYAPGTVALLVADSVERLGDVAVTHFVPLLVQRFARERLLAGAQADGLIRKYVPNVVFICSQNAGRSQMAAALARHVCEGRICARSAGSDPAGHIDLAVVEAMAELGIDMAFEYPKPVTDEVLRAADVVVTMGCDDACPVVAGPRYRDWHIADPAGRDLDEVRAIRLDITNHVLDLLKELLP
jgi:arsenate reductase (thioredoxin)